MMRFFLGVFLFLAIFVNASAENSIDESRIFSRSIMDHCGFVYRVESDIRIAIVAETLEEFKKNYGTQVSLYVEFFNSWDNEPRSMGIVASLEDFEEGSQFASDLKDYEVFQFTVESMSTSSRYLYREMRFAIQSKAISSSEYLTPWYYADIGRRFGEACQSSRNSKTPWFEREITHEIAE